MRPIGPLRHRKPRKGNTLRKWNWSRVVYEHHYDQQRSGEPLTFDDLGFDMIAPVAGFQRGRDRRSVAVAFIAAWDRSVSSRFMTGDHQSGAIQVTRNTTCVKASKRGKKSFVRQRQSSIKKDTTALHFPISCEPLVWKKAGFTGTLRAKKSLRETPSTTPGKLQWARASKEQRRSRIPLIVSNKSCGTFATGV